MRDIGGPCGGMTFICGAKDKPFKKTSSGNAFREACDQAVVSNFAHGVRKIGATTAADNGATEKALDAIFGWEGGDMVRLYTESQSSAQSV